VIVIHENAPDLNDCGAHGGAQAITLARASSVAVRVFWIASGTKGLSSSLAISGSLARKDS
jgi:hypothetical protein